VANDDLTNDDGLRAAGLAAELIAMTNADKQAQGGAFGEDYDAQLAYRRITVRNGDRLTEIMTEYGWPGRSLVGDEAARRAWLIAQHADRQLDVQRRALMLMERAVVAGEADPAHLAFLRDRVLINEGRRQVYGTQIAGVHEGVPIPWPSEDQDPDRIDALRAQVGIAPFSAHVAKHPRSPDQR
jgi:hypothetical protein